MVSRSEVQALARAAATLGRRAGLARQGLRRDVALPTLWLVTDPARLPDPVAAAARLPRGSAVIYRAFGRADAVEVGLALAAVARRRGLVLLAGADAGLAAAIGADGVHLPERSLAQAAGLKARRPHWIVTGAAHGARALRLAGRMGVDAVLVSPALPSRSPSAGRPLGPLRLAQLVALSEVPVIALGGVTARTAPQLCATGAAGLAAVEGLGRGEGFQPG